MNPLLIGISLFATLLSTISYLSSPGEIIRNGPIMLTGALAIPIAYVICGYLLIPAFMRYRLTSAYELLESKLGLSSRLIGAAMFITLRLMWMATLLNFASNAMLVMLAWESHWLLPITVHSLRSRASAMTSCIATCAPSQSHSRADCNSLPK